MAAEHKTVTVNGQNIHEVLQYITGVENLKLLLKHGEIPCNECFVLAARIGSFSTVCKLLEVVPSGINTKDQNGVSLLSHFSWNSNNVLELLKMGANPIINDIETVIEDVIMYSRNDKDVIEILKILLSAGVQLDTVNGVPLLKLLASKPHIFSKALELDGIHPNVPEIHEVMKILLLPPIKCDFPTLVEIFTKLSNMGINLVDNKGITLLKYCHEKFTLVKMFINLRAPLKPYLSQALKTCVAEHYSSIEQVEDLRKILETVINNGHELVDEEGFSLVKHCNNQYTLLCLLRLGATPFVTEIHKLLATLEDTKILKEIYSIVAAAGLTLVDDHGCPLIMFYYNKPDIICHLLKLGASPFHEGKNLLENAFISNRDPITELESYIESGFNVMAKDKNGCTFLCTAIKICIKRKTKPESLELVRYMLKHLDIIDKNFKLTCKSGYHPQELMICCGRLRGSELVNVLLNSKFKEPNHVLTNMKLFPNDPFFQNYAPVEMSLISYLIKKTKSSNSEDIYNDIDYLRQHWFSVNAPGVSPLTVVQTINFDSRTSFNFFVQRGVNVEKSVVQYMDHELNFWKESLRIPDVAVVAAESATTLLDIIDLLEPHLAFPPLGLLLVIRDTSVLNNKEYLPLFSALLRGGRVPHGTVAYETIRDNVSDLADNEIDPPALLLPIEPEIPEQIGGIESEKLTIFDVAHRSPLTLLELSRVAVLMQLADTAAASDTQSLAQLFASLLPPGLNDQMIRRKIAQVREAEDKWLPNELHVLENSTSLNFFKSLFQVPDYSTTSDSENMTSDSGNEASENDYE